MLTFPSPCPALLVVLPLAASAAALPRCRAAVPGPLAPASCCFYLAITLPERGALVPVLDVLGAVMPSQPSQLSARVSSRQPGPSLPPRPSIPSVIKHAPIKLLTSTVKPLILC